MSGALKPRAQAGSSGLVCESIFTDERSEVGRGVSHSERSGAEGMARSGGRASGNERGPMDVGLPLVLVLVRGFVCG